MSGKKRENEYRDAVRYTLMNYGIVLWGIADSYQVVNGITFSLPRYTDMFGLMTGGKHVSCELKIGDHPVISKFTNNEKQHLAEVERLGGMALIVCIHASTNTMSCFGYAKGDFVAISSMANLPLRKEPI